MTYKRQDQAERCGQRGIRERADSRDELSSLRAHARERTFERATLSLKLHDFDNIGFTKEEVGYEQFIASAWKSTKVACLPACLPA